MKKIAQTLIAAGLLSMGTAAQAADTGFYIGGSLGQSKISDFNGSDIDAELLSDYGITSSTNTDDSDTGYKVFAGYRIMKYLAVEGAYTDFGKFTANSSVTAPGAGVVNTEVEPTAWTISALGILPLGDNFSLFGRLGVNIWDADISASGSGSGGVASVSDSTDGTDWVYGVGAAYSFTENLSLRGEWERYDLDGSDTDLWSAGISWSF